jgi:hypothetical protein
MSSEVEVAFAVLSTAFTTLQQQQQQQQQPGTW